MAISHELSSEIATALFSARERSPRELKDLKEVIFKIHSALEQLALEAHLSREFRHRSTLQALTKRAGQ